MTKEQKPSTDPTPLQAIGIVWEVFLTIAIPVTCFALGGRWLDHRTGWSPLFTIVGFLLAVVVTSILIKRKAETLRKTLYPK